MTRPFPDSWRSAHPPMNETITVARIDPMNVLDFHRLADGLAAAHAPGSATAQLEATELMRLCLYTLGYVDGLDILDALQEAPTAEDSPSAASYEEETAISVQAVEQARQKEIAPLAESPPPPPVAEKTPTEADGIVEEMKADAAARPGVMPVTKQDVIPAPGETGETE